MSNNDPHDAIERLEADIEDLAAKIENCRKFIWAGRIAMVGGTIVLAAILLGAIRSDLTWMAGAMAAILGGIVVFGSNDSTAKEAANEMAAAEASRAALIGSIDLRVVPRARHYIRPQRYFFSSLKYASTGPVSLISSGLPWRSLVLPASTRIQPSLTQYSVTLVFSAPLKRMPTSRSSALASKYGLRGSVERRSGGDLGIAVLCLAYGLSARGTVGYTGIMSLAADSLPPFPALGLPRHDWTRGEVGALFDLPFPELMFQAQSAHRANFDPTEVQISTLLSIKTGGCPEDCAYCPQSARYDTGVRAEKLMALDAVLAEARAAKSAGASRFCMGAAWREPKDRDLDTVCAMVEGVRALGLETCATLGMLTAPQARRLKGAGLDYYNHNLDTSPEFYDRIITTRTYQDRLETLDHVRGAGIHVCCGGIVGMGETRGDRIGMIAVLASLPVHPESVPINMLVKVAGTPLAGQGISDSGAFDPLEFVRTIAVARITMPRSVVRLSAGREDMSEETQALCFLAGANSIFYGPKLLTTPNPGRDRDRELMDKLGLAPMGPTQTDSQFGNS